MRNITDITFYPKPLHQAITSAMAGLQPIPGDPKDNGVSAMLDDRTFCFVIQHGRHAIVMHISWIFKDWLQISTCCSWVQRSVTETKIVK